MPTQEQHPIEYLFNERKSVAPDHYGKVIPVPEMIAQTAFFPGGAGLWHTPPKEVLPSSLQDSYSFFVNSKRPTMPTKKVMVLGNDFGPKSWHEKYLRQEDRDLNSCTWQNLLEYLHYADLQPKDCFFTNAYMGLRRLENKKSTGPSPGKADSEFVERCESFFVDKQIPVQKPRLILALGEHSIDFIAGLSCDLTEWKKCKNFKELDDSDLGPVVKRVSFNSSQPATVVALVHPSGRKMFDRKNVKGRCYRGAKGEKAELKMLKRALKKSGLKK